MKIHVTQSGDSLYKIAQQYGVSMTQLINDNQLPDPSCLTVGQAIVVRFPQVCYTVLAGDTLASIARHHDMTVRQILRNNPALQGCPTIYPGQVLVLDYDDHPTTVTRSYGYAYPTIPKSLYRSTLPYLTAVAPFTHPITGEGDLEGLKDKDMVETATQMGTLPVLHVSTLLESGFSAALARQLLTSTDAQATLIAQIVEVATTEGYRGVDLDFEGVPGGDAVAYAKFVDSLKKALTPYEIPVIVALAPKTSSDQRGEQYEGHNYALLGQAADIILLMTYEWGYSYSAPMAVSPIGGVRKVVEYAITQMPAEKIMLGLPNYGYDWILPHVQGNRAKSIGCQDAVTLAVQNRVAIRYDESSQTPWFRYSDQYGTEHEVWFEDPRSIVAKLKLVKEFGLGGVGYWNLDRPFPQTYVVLNGMLKIKDYK